MFGNLSDTSKSWISKLILALLMVPFAFFGVDYYFRGGGGGGDAVAVVEGQQISRYEFERALRDQMERMRAMFGKNFNSAMFDSPQMRKSILDGIVNQRLLAHVAGKSGMTVTDQELRDKIQAVEAFHDSDGKFSPQRYQDLLRSQGMAPSAFETSVRRDELVSLVRNSVTDTALVPNLAVDSFIRFNEQQRVVSRIEFKADEFLAQAEVKPEAVKAYYTAHPDEFKIPEQVKLDYLLLSQEGLAAKVSVSPDDVKKVYEENLKKQPNPYVQAEERQASHILISVEANAKEDAKKAALAKAEELAKQAKAAPDKFADLAQKESQDPGSAKQGGDLGFFGRGAMVKPFEDAVFAMKQGDIVGPIKSDFGYHIIKLVGIKAEKVRTLEEVAPQLTADLKKQAAARQFGEAQEQLGNLVFEQSTSLKPAADALKLEVRHSGWVSAQGSETDPLLANPKLMQAVLAPEVLKEKRNSAVVEVQPTILVVARVTEHKDASLKPLEEVSAALTQRLKRDEAVKLAAAKGKETLEKLKKGDAVAGLTWPEAKPVSHNAPGDTPPPVVTAAFRAPSAKLPGYLGVDLPGTGYALVRLDKVIDGVPDDEKRKAARAQLQSVLAQDELQAMVASLRDKTTVTLKNKDALEPTREK